MRRWLTGLVAVVVVAGCGGSDPPRSDEDRIRTLIEDYLAAVARGAPADACEFVSARVLRRRSSIADVSACREINTDGAPPPRPGTADVGAIEVDGDRADVALELEEGVETTALVVREPRGWRIDQTGPAGDPTSDERPYRVPSEAMLPTFELGETVVGDRSAYQDAAPRYGDVVLLHPSLGALDAECGAPVRPGAACATPKPTDTSLTFIERVVGLPGDRIAFRDGRAVRNGRADTFAVEPCPPDTSACDLPRAITVPEGHVFVAGDNRPASNDSRVWGPVPFDAIVARVE